MQSPPAALRSPQLAERTEDARHAWHDGRAVEEVSPQQRPQPVVGAERRRECVPRARTRAAARSRQRAYHKRQGVFGGDHCVGNVRSSVDVERGGGRALWRRVEQHAEQQQLTQRVRESVSMSGGQNNPTTAIGDTHAARSSMMSVA